MRFGSLALLMLALACAPTMRTGSAESEVSYRLRADQKPISSPPKIIWEFRGPDPRFYHGYDAVILAPNAGLRTPAKFAVRDVYVVYGGRLGSGYVADPASTLGKFVLFLPPLDADGEVVFQPSAWNALLAPYARAAAIGVISLDETPRGLADALTNGDFVEAPPKGEPLPPVLLFPAKPALALIDFADRGHQLPMPGVIGRRLTVVGTWERARR
jgi:hypothetical protein